MSQISFSNPYRHPENCARHPLYSTPCQMCEHEGRIDDLTASMLGVPEDEEFDDEELDEEEFDDEELDEEEFDDEEEEFEEEEDFDDYEEVEVETPDEAQAIIADVFSMFRRSWEEAKRNESNW